MTEDEAEPHPGRPPSTAALVGHAAALWLGLLLLMPVVGVDRSPLITDEGALLMQLEILDDHGSWYTPYPLLDLDPDGAYVPLAYSNYENGELIPYSSRPAYVLLNLLPFRSMGIWGVTALGSLFAALAALATGLTARHLQPSAALPALWLVGVASPLFVHAQILQGHTIGAAAAAGGCLIAVRAQHALGQRWVALLLIGLTMFAATTVRREVLFVAAGLLAWGALRIVTKRTTFDAALGLAASAGGFLGLAVDRVLVWQIQGVSAAPNIPVASDSEQSLLADRLWSLYHSTIRFSFGDLTIADTVALIALVLVVVGSIQVRRRADCVLLVVGLVAMTGLALVQAIATHDAPHLVPGIFMASPLLFAGLLLVPPTALRERAGALLAVVAAVTTVLVLALQYQGSWEWGARFLSVSIPPVATLSAVGWIRGVALVNAPARRTLAAAASITVIAIAGLAVTGQHDGRMATRELASTLVAEASERDDLIVTTELWMPRLDTSQLGPVQHRWARAAPEEMPSLLGMLADEGVDQLVLAAWSGRELPALIGDTGWQLEREEPLPPLRLPLTMWLLSR